MKILIFINDELMWLQIYISKLAPVQFNLAQFVDFEVQI